MRTGLASLWGSLALLACTAAPPEPEKVETSTVRLTSTSASTTPGISGYAHKLAKSLFDPGAGARQASDQGFDKIVGSYGVFAVDQSNGSASASRSSTGVQIKYQGTAAQHNAAVRSYFIGAGMPESEIGNVTTHTVVRGTGNTTDALSGTQAPPEIVAYTTSIGRTVAGYPIVESIAWAELDGNGKVVAETVYWPDLPGPALAEATAFSAMLGDPTRAAAFSAQIPSGVDPGQVAIHHSTLTERGTFETRVTYDAMTTNKHGGYLRHFDRSGSEIRLPREQLSGSKAGP